MANTITKHQFNQQRLSKLTKQIATGEASGLERLEFYLRKRKMI